ncbi:MAG: APH(3') family aminoglycoside O-phosphotransferase [Bacillaceae bacterium]
MPVKVPHTLEKQIKEYEQHPITLGHSESQVFLLKGTNRNLYLKIQSNDGIERLVEEKEKLQWLKGKLPVPDVLFYDQDDDYEYMLISEIEGINASDSFHRENVSQVMHVLGKGLKEIHRIQIADCPFDQCLDVKVNEVKRRVADGLVDEEDFDEIRQGMKATELLEQLIEKQPKQEDLVFAHGDFCLPNILINENKVSGYIDWGRGGIADKYQDIALAVRSITSNFGEEYVPFFLEGYGLEYVDEERIAYYQLLDEFF